MQHFWSGYIGNKSCCHQEDSNLLFFSFWFVTYVSVCVCVLTDYTECVHISINYICNGYILIRAPRGQPTGTIGGMH